MQHEATKIPALTVMSSMATRQVLADLCARHASATGQTVTVESIGGVDAANRVRAGEVVDAVVLAAAAIDGLTAAGHLLAGSRVDVARTGVAIAVRSGAPRPDVATEKALRQAVLDAATVGYSTGPSGAHLVQLFERWDIAEAIRDRIVTAPPGVPVASLVAGGQVELGFQQLSELIHAPGIEVVGPLPPEVQTLTVFAGGVAAASARPEAAAELLAFLASPAAADAKLANGMEPA